MDKELHTTEYSAYSACYIYLFQKQIHIVSEWQFKMSLHWTKMCLFLKTMLTHLVAHRYGTQIQSSLFLQMTQHLMAQAISRHSADSKIRLNVSFQVILTTFNASRDQNLAKLIAFLFL